MNLQDKLSSLRRADAGTDQKIAKQYPANWNMDHVFRRAYRKYQEQMPVAVPAARASQSERNIRHIFQMSVPRIVTAACLVLTVGICGTIGVLKLSMRKPDAIPKESVTTAATTAASTRKTEVTGENVTTAVTGGAISGIGKITQNAAASSTDPLSAELTASSPSDGDTQSTQTVQPDVTTAQTDAESDDDPVTVFSYTGTTISTFTITSLSKTTTTTTRTTASQANAVTQRTTVTQKTTTTTQKPVTSQRQGQAGGEIPGGDTGGGPPMADNPVEDAPTQPATGGGSGDSKKPDLFSNDHYANDGSYSIGVRFPGDGREYAPTRPTVTVDHYHISDDGGGVYRIDDDWSHHSGFLKVYANNGGTQEIPFNRDEFPWYEEVSVNGGTGYMVHGKERVFLVWFDGEYLCSLYTDVGFEYNLYWMAEAIKTH